MVGGDAGGEAEEGAAAIDEAGHGAHTFFPIQITFPTTSISSRGRSVEP